MLFVGKRCLAILESKELSWLVFNHVLQLVPPSSSSSLTLTPWLTSQPATNCIQDIPTRTQYCIILGLHHRDASRCPSSRCRDPFPYDDKFIPTSTLSNPKHTATNSYIPSFTNTAIFLLTSYPIFWSPVCPQRISTPRASLTQTFPRELSIVFRPRLPSTTTSIFSTALPRCLIFVLTSARYLSSQTSSLALSSSAQFFSHSFSYSTDFSPCRTFHSHILPAMPETQ